MQVFCLICPWELGVKRSNCRFPFSRPGAASVLRLWFGNGAENRDLLNDGAFIGDSPLELSWRTADAFAAPLLAVVVVVAVPNSPCSQPSDRKPERVLVQWRR